MDTFTQLTDTSSMGYHAKNETSLAKTRTPRLKSRSNRDSDGRRRRRIGLLSAAALLPQPLGPASVGLPGMYQQQPQTSAGLQPTLMQALNACQQAAAPSGGAAAAQAWALHKPPGSNGQMKRTGQKREGAKDGLQCKSLAESCKSLDADC